MDTSHTPSRSQRAAIEAELRPLLVLAGPGSGKTRCLIDRIGQLIEVSGIASDRICAFTFTNRAAEEIGKRLDRLGSKAALVRRTTIHKLCIDLLREHGDHVGAKAGFGIADDKYQMAVLWRLEPNPKWRDALPKQFSLHRLRGDELYRQNAELLRRYEEVLTKQNLLDFDQLLLKTAELLMHVGHVADVIRSRWDAVLVDEFQDLNPIQYSIVRELARMHRNVFAVGDFDQSIFGWAGATPKVFSDFVNDFRITEKDRVELKENHRCPKAVFELARRFVAANPLLPGLGERPEITADKPSLFPVEAFGFADESRELEWIIKDLDSQRKAHGLRWGDFALLYRRHKVGNVAEPVLLSAGIPCRLAHGRAVAEDPIVRYVASALRVMAKPDDDLYKEAFLGIVLPKSFRNLVRAEAEANHEAPYDRLKRMSLSLPKDDANRDKLHRAFYALRNFGALARRHTNIGALVEELLSRRVGEYVTPLERQHHLLSDPESSGEARGLAFRIAGLLKADRPAFVPRLGGVEIPIKAMLHGMGLRAVHIGRTVKDAETIGLKDSPSGDLACAVFKAGQILAARKLTYTFNDFVAFDIETTSTDSANCAITEVAAVRVRNGGITDEFSTLVNPGVPIPPDAIRLNGISDADVAGAPSFTDVWPKLRAFFGGDVVVAHNGFGFDFKVLSRYVGGLTGFGTYDTLPLAQDLVPTSRSLSSLARHYSIDTGQSHRALDDSRCLVKVFQRLNDARLSHARKTSLVNMLDQLGVALALTGPHSADSETKLLLDLARPFSLGRYSDCLENYRAQREELSDESIPDVDHVIDALGGAELLNRIRSERNADDRYPVSMSRLRRLLEGCEAGDLRDQIGSFLDRIALSFTDGQARDRDRVNLLTLYSAKGLEFSRVYILGVEDEQFAEESKARLEESRRVLYVGMTRTLDRLVLTRVATRGGTPTGGTQFLDAMGLTAKTPS